MFALIYADTLYMIRKFNVEAERERSPGTLKDFIPRWINWRLNRLRCISAIEEDLTVDGRLQKAIVEAGLRQAIAVALSGRWCFVLSHARKNNYNWFTQQSANVEYLYYIIGDANIVTWSGIMLTSSQANPTVKRQSTKCRYQCFLTLNQKPPASTHHQTQA